MTTTLRPAGPEERHDDGGRARSYDVCVNSRRVGGIRLTTDARFGPVAGRIEALDIDRPDRHRGRATVAALAAEEVLRGWGCKRIEVSVPADAEAAVRLAAALGYTERSRKMTKPLDVPPELPEASHERRMSASEYPAWRDAAIAEHIRVQTGLGVPRERAERASYDGHAAMLPDGAKTRGHALRVLSHRGVDVGTLWVAVEIPGHPGGYVIDVTVDPGHRGRGHGRTLMLVAERVCLAAGRPVLGLNAYADNAPALALYGSLGYRPTVYELGKRIL